MGLLEIVKRKQQESKHHLCCPNCQGSMYPLKESLNRIYVCESCGTSVDEENSAKFDKSSDGGTLPIYNLFNNEFMKKYTDFHCFQDFIDHCRINLEEITLNFDESNPTKNPHLLDKYVQENTRFLSWNEMFEKAVELHLHV